MGTTTYTYPGGTTTLTSSTGTSTLILPGTTVVETTPDPPGAPELHAILAGPDGSLQLNWTIPPSNGAQIQGYRVYRATSSGGQTLLAETPPAGSDGTVSYVDAQVAAGTTYFYKVSAFNSF